MPTKYLFFVRENESEREKNIASLHMYGALFDTHHTQIPLVFTAERGERERERVRVACHGSK
jgi:hypothetical protein